MLTNLSVQSVTEEAELVLFKIKTLLTQSSLSSRDIISTVIVLRAMRDFSSINKVYTHGLIIY